MEASKARAGGDRIASEMLRHKFFMNEALKEARESLADGGYGIGAVLVLDDKIIARSKGSETYLRQDPTMHAETRLIDMIKGTSSYTPENLKKFVVYTTVQACPMCYCTLLVLGVGKIVYGAKDDNGGFSPSKESIPPIFQDNMPAVIGGVLEAECEKVFLANREELDGKYSEGKFV